MVEFIVSYATAEHHSYVDAVVDAIDQAATVKGTGIARRSADYILDKINQGKAVIAITNYGEFAGFCYIESWEHQRYVANSGLIVVDKFRGMNLAKSIKNKAFELSREKFPNAKLFGLTTSLAVMKINSELGYVPVTFSELADDSAFWKGCESCSYYDILVRTKRHSCLCTAMIFDPAIHDVRRQAIAAVNEQKAE
jgi:hypothetical protein